MHTLPSQIDHFLRQAEMLANRVKKRFRHFHKRFSRQGIEVFRLYDWDIPEIRAVVDWYGGHPGSSASTCGASLFPSGCR